MVDTTLMVADLLLTDKEIFYIPQSIALFEKLGYIKEGMNNLECVLISRSIAKTAQDMVPKRDRLSDKMYIIKGDGSSINMEKKNE